MIVSYPGVPDYANITGRAVLTIEMWNEAKDIFLALYKGFHPSTIYKQLFPDYRHAQFAQCSKTQTPFLEMIMSLLVYLGFDVVRARTESPQVFPKTNSNDTTNYDKVFTLRWRGLSDCVAAKRAGQVKVWDIIPQNIEYERAPEDIAAVERALTTCENCMMAVVSPQPATQLVVQQTPVTPEVTSFSQFLPFGRRRN